MANSERKHNSKLLQKSFKKTNSSLPQTGNATRFSFSINKWVHCCILAFGLLLFNNFSALAQRTTSRVVVPVTIENVVIVDESKSGLIDGMIKVTIDDNNPQRSTYRLSYDFLTEGNNFVSEELSSVNNVITLTNARIGGYYNLKVIRTADNQASETASAFSVKNGPVDEKDNGNTSNLQCSGTLSYTSCSGSSRSISKSY